MEKLAQNPVAKLLNKATALVQSRWFVRLRTCLTVYLDIKLIFFMFLQAQYELLYARCISTARFPSADNREELLQQLEMRRSLMRGYGNVLRDMGLLAMFGFSAILCCHLIFMLSDTLTGGLISAKYRQDNFFIAYLEPGRYCSQLNEIYDRYLLRMLQLNTEKRQTIRANYELSSFNLKRTNEMIGELNEHQIHLRSLLADKSDIWPETGSLVWRQKQRKYLITYYTGFFISLDIICITVISLAVYLAQKAIEVRGEKPMNFLEKLCLLELFSILTTDQLVVPAVLMFVSLRDKIIYLQSIRRRFKQLNLKLLELEWRRQQQQQQQQPDKPADQTSAGVDCLRAECDTEAMQIYLSLRVFMDGLRPTSALASLILNQYCLLALVMLASSLPFYTSSSNEQLLISVSIAIDLVLMINLSFIICAVYESVCIKTIHCAWSLVARITMEVTEAEEQESKLQGPINLEHLNAVTLQKIGPSSPKSLTEYFRFSKVKDNLINDHTATLWRKFVEDVPALHKSFHCQVFGLLQLNYSGLLKLNFWYISIVLIFLTQKWE